jgi:hypothetical protein
MENFGLKSKLLLTTIGLALTTACAKIEFSPIPVTAQETPEPESQVTPKTISKSEFVAFGNKQVDFLLVLDDSYSMLPELKKLAAKMTSFVTSLDASNLDWQMCVTTTRGNLLNGRMVYGSPLAWKNYLPKSGVPNTVLKKGTLNLPMVFTSTVDSLTIGGGYSGDERAIKATHENFSNSKTNNCYREGAAISVIVISDEDERSVGGLKENVKETDSTTAFQPFEPEDLPSNLIEQAKASFGEPVRFTFNSIIVKPDDKACEEEQDKDTSPSHFGHTYFEASRLTEGGVGSICDKDYGSNLNIFRDKIVNSLSTLKLECDADPRTMEVKIEGAHVSGLKLDGKNLKFTYPLIEGTKIDLKYECKD